MWFDTPYYNVNEKQFGDNSPHYVRRETLLLWPAGPEFGNAAALFDGPAQLWIFMAYSLLGRHVAKGTDTHSWEDFIRLLQLLP